jgi:hypothetical protein
MINLQELLEKVVLELGTKTFFEACKRADLSVDEVKVLLQHLSERGE